MSFLIDTATWEKLPGLETILEVDEQVDTRSFLQERLGQETPERIVAGVPHPWHVLL